MKKILAVALVVITLAATFTSCSSSRSARGGCKATNGMVGYR